MTVATVMAIVSVATAVAGAISGADAESAVASANQRSSETTATSKNRARMWSNYNTIAQNNLGRFVQSINNNRKLAAAGQSLGTQVTNYRRQKDVLLNSGFEQSIAEAEQLGSQHASAAVAGIGGSVADNINSATILRQDRIKGQAAAAENAMDFDFRQGQSAIVQNAIDGLDNKTVFDNLDNNIDVALKYASPTWFGKFLGNGGIGTLSNAGQTIFSTSGSSGKMGGNGVASNSYEFNSGVGGFTGEGVYG